MIRFVLDRIVQRFPDGVLTVVGVLRQLTAATDFLCIQKIDVPIFQHFHIEGILCNGHALAKAQLAGFQLDFLLGLRIQFRRIRKPYEDGLRLLIKSRSVHQCGAKENIFDQRSGNNGLSRAGRRLQGNNLRFPSAAETVQSVSNVHAQFLDSLLLKSY